MHRESISPLFLAALSVVLVFACGGQAGAADLLTLLPSAADLPGWTAQGQPQVYEGLDLYELINGGAEVYHEYGFQQVLAQEYGDEEQRYLSLEIYEMVDPTAAYGIYSFRTGESDRVVAVGSEAFLSDYYLNVWYGRYLLTLSGTVSDAAMRDGLVAVGKAVVARIPEAGEPPALLDLVPREPWPPVKTWYLAGDLALFNLAKLSDLTPLGFATGVAAQYDGFRLFVLAFETVEQTQARYTAAVDRLTTRYPDSPAEATNRTLPGLWRADDKGAPLYLEPLNDHLLVTIGADGATIATIREAVHERLAPATDDKH